MKTKILYFFLLVIAQSASARIGETFDQVADRYGSTHGIATATGTDELGNTIRGYEFGGFLVVVAFEHGVSACERFSKKDEGELQKEEIDAVLAANAPAGATWKPDNLLGWDSSDGRLNATHAFNALRIWTKDYRARLRAELDLLKAKRLEGF